MDTLKTILLILALLYAIDRLIVFIRFCLEPDYFPCDGGKE